MKFFQMFSVFAGAAISFVISSSQILANNSQDDQEFYLRFLETGELADDAIEDIECLAHNIYHEARGEEEIGQIAVAYVTMNRVEHWYFPDSVCDVVWEPGQFSWTRDGRSDAMYDEERAEFALDVAVRVYYQIENDPVQGALFYHATYINAPSWTRQMNLVDRIGIHKFYTWDGEWN